MRPYSYFLAQNFDDYPIVPMHKSHRPNDCLARIDLYFNPITLLLFLMKPSPNGRNPILSDKDRQLPAHIFLP